MARVIRVFPIIFASMMFAAVYGGAAGARVAAVAAAGVDKQDGAEAARIVSVAAMVEGLDGAVEIRDYGAKLWRNVAVGQQIGAGVTVRTGPGASCLLKWAGGNSARLEGGAVLTVEALSMTPAEGSRASVFYLGAGKLYGRAPKPEADGTIFRVRTPSGAADMGGAMFSVYVDTDGASSVEVAGGEAIVADGNMNWVKLGGGQGAVVRAASRPEGPSRLGRGEVERFKMIEGIGNPGLEIIEPGADFSGDDPHVAVRGRATPGADVSVNGAAAAADANGFFSTYIDMKDGENKIEIKAVNNYGLAASRYISIVYPPVRAGLAEDATVAPPDAAAAYNGGDASGSARPPRWAEIVSESGDVSGVIPGVSRFMVSAPANDGGGGVVSEAGHIANGFVSDGLTRDTSAPLITVVQPYELFESGTAGCAGPEEALVCNVVGATEPNAAVTINGRSFEAQPDGSFNARVSMTPRDSAIVVRARDGAGNIGEKVVQRSFKPGKVVYLSVSVNPAQISADNVSIAVITVTGINLIGEPVDGTELTVTAGPGGTLSANSATLRGGNATVNFRAGVGAVRTTVPIKVQSGSVTASASLLLIPDAPPGFED